MNAYILSLDKKCLCRKGGWRQSWSIFSLFVLVMMKYFYTQYILILLICSSCCLINKTILNSSCYSLIELNSVFIYLTLMLLHFFSKKKPLHTSICIPLQKDPKVIWISQELLECFERNVENICIGLQVQESIWWWHEASVRNYLDKLCDG